MKEMLAEGIVRGVTACHGFRDAMKKCEVFGLLNQVGYRSDQLKVNVFGEAVAGRIEDRLAVGFDGVFLFHGGSKWADTGLSIEKW